MKFNKIVFCLLLALLSLSIAHAAMAESSTGTKKLDLSKYHNVGNIWLRVSNYGFFGSGSEAYPSLEYPGGSRIDYLFQGSLWFGAKKYRRDANNRKLYWLSNPPTADNDDMTYEGATNWNPNLKVVIDTLTSLGFDGDLDLFEFLPAYNPNEASSTNPTVIANIGKYDELDRIASASIRTQQRGEDDDGDGIIDEDFVGYTFKLRRANELPEVFQDFGDLFLYQTRPFSMDVITVPANNDIWFPLGFMDLSDRTHNTYDFSNAIDDDNDGLFDEDGAPVSEQDFISYYYDYSPFNTPGDRDLGSRRGESEHFPLGVRVRQMSYQWSYDYIKNLVYVEFDITNMSQVDTLYDCAMGIYMDCDCGPQSWGSEKAADDKSGYVRGTGYEFAYTFDADGDGGLTPGRVGARVCTPDPEDLDFDCWFWEVGDGPDDFSPRNLSYAPKLTANEKYWLLTGRNPDQTKFTKLRPLDGQPPNFEQTTPMDTRFLFSFYGDMAGTTAPTTGSWNLAPSKTMKIVVAVFPGADQEDLKKSARWAKEIYGEAQKLVNVVMPDTFPHYNPPEPPEIPKVFAEIVDDGKQIDVYWDNRSEFSEDNKTVSSAVMGWQYNPTPEWQNLDSDPAFIGPAVYSTYPPEFQPPSNPLAYNNEATVNPFTAFRLRHDFQGYTLWGRSGSGSQEDWTMKKRWDKKETAQDLQDYQVNDGHPKFVNYGGYLSVGTGLPNRNDWDVPVTEYTRFTKMADDYYHYIANPDTAFYGYPLYNPDVNQAAAVAAAQDIQNQFGDMGPDYVKMLQARLYKYPDTREEIYDALLDDKLIPLEGHGGKQSMNDEGKLAELRNKRLARRYYKQPILSPQQGVEYYVAVTAYDRGIPNNDLNFLETGRDADANMKIIFPGKMAKEKMDNIYVVPNPYIGRSSFDGLRDKDPKGDKSRRLWFVNIPENCMIRIYTLAGDLVDEIDHRGAANVDLISSSRAAQSGIAATGIQDWDLLSKFNQIIAPGVYLYSVENKADKKIKVGKFVIIK